MPVLISATTTVLLLLLASSLFTTIPHVLGVDPDISQSKKRQIDDLILPDCSVDGDCSNFALASYCTNFSCVNGSCTMIGSNVCHSTKYESCNEKTQSCVGCSILGDYSCTALTMDYLRSNNNMLYCDSTVEYLCNLSHPVVKSSDQTEIGKVLYGDCIFTQYDSPIRTRCKQPTPFCNSENASCVECITDVDCLIRFGLVTKVSTASSGGTSSEYIDPRALQPVVVPGCLPPMICSRLDGKCYFHSVLPSAETIPFSSAAAAYNVPSSQTFYINYTEASKGYDYWSSKYLPSIMQDPCDTLEQKNSTGGETILTCSMVNFVSCSPTACTTDSECDDFNECNGKEYCDAGYCKYSMQNTCSSQFSGEKPFCNETAKICETCLQDDECRSLNTDCMLMGVCMYNPTIERNECKTISRCAQVTEVCVSPSLFPQNTNKLESLLLQFNYSITENGLPEVPQNLRNRTTRNWRSLDTYDDPSFYVQEAFLANQDFNKKNGDVARQSPNYINPVGTTLDEKITSFVNQFLALDTKKTGFLPLNFDPRRIYCSSIYCSTNADCPTGTICATYSKFNQTRKKCVTCDHDHQCQDGIKCNGREKCHHLEGTCRRSKHSLCYNETLNKAYRCDERTGRCIGGGPSNGESSLIHGESQVDYVAKNSGEAIDVVLLPPVDSGYIPVSRTLTNTSMGAVVSITLVVSIAGILAAALLYASLGGGHGTSSENTKYHRKKR